MRIHELMELPEMEAVECELPERSLLYRIPVMGSEAGQVEGLLSYLVRVAQAHSVNPRRLVRVVFALGNPEFGKLNRTGFFISHAGTVNGLGKYAELFLGEMAKLTGADFLRPLCLLPLKDLLPPNGAGLLTRLPKWCPHCIGAMAKSGEDVYRPLAWSFELYRVCVRHGVLLQEVCGHCGKTQPFIPRYPDWGRCDHCGWFLGGGKAENSKSNLDQWVSAAIADLVQHLLELDGLVTTQKFTSFIGMAVEQLADGNRAKFCELVGLPRWALTGWLSHDERPSLPQLLSVCYGLNIMPSALFLREPKDLIVAAQGEVRPAAKKLLEREGRPSLSINERQRIGRSLAEIVNNIEDVRPMSAVAKSLGLSRSCLKYWFPEECAVILSKHDAARKLRIAARKVEEKNVVTAVVQAIKARGEYPSRRKVDIALRSHKLSLVRKELLKVYRHVMEVGNS